MSIQRRTRRTDLREGSLDLSNIFLNPQLTAEGKIILPQNVNSQQWLTQRVLFSELTETVSQSSTNDYHFDLPSLIAHEEETQGGSPFMRIYINGVKLVYNNSFTIDSQTCNLTLMYPIDSTDLIDIWYVAAQ